MCVLSVILLSVVMQIVVILIVIMMNVFMIGVVILIVVAPISVVVYYLFDAMNDKYICKTKKIPGNSVFIER